MQGSLPGPTDPRVLCHAGGVRHAKLILHRLRVDGTDTDVSLGTLVAVSREGRADLDWEVVAQTVGASEPQLGSVDLSLVVVSGADDAGAPELTELSGRAVVVRYVDSTVVWRGDGPLTGFEDAWLL